MAHLHWLIEWVKEHDWTKVEIMNEDLVFRRGVGFGFPSSSVKERKRRERERKI